MVCENCKTWELLEGDEFCSWCGEKVVNVQLIPQPLRLYLDADPARGNVFSTTVLKNISAVPLSPRLESAPAWFKSAKLSKSLVQPDEHLDVFLEVDVTRLGGVLIKAGKLVFELAHAEANKENRLSKVVIDTEVWPAPQLTVKPLTVFSGRAHTEVLLQTELSSPVAIEAIAFDKPYLAFDGQLPVTLDIGDSALPFQLNLPEQITDRTTSMSFEFRVKGLENPITGHLDLEIKRPATLELRAASARAECELIPGDVEELEFRIANSGEETLVIDRMQVVPMTKQTSVVVSLDGDLPQTIEPSREETIRFKAAASASSAPERYWFKLGFQSNDPNAEHNSHYLLVTVTDEECPEFIAIDFGTTDSTVAIFDGGNRTPINLPLEKGNLDPKIYSNVLFMNVVEVNEPPYEWCIGTDARILGPLFRERFVKAIKTKAGTNHKEIIDFREKAISRELDAEEIIKFIMMDLVTRTKIALRQRPVRFILSVPTLFTLRRKEILKQTFTEAARSLSLNIQALKTIDESLAAGLFYILLTGPLDEWVNKKKTYTMMMLDFGGGTTDITVLRVRQQISSDNSLDVEEVEVIGAWGDAMLGGEEVTKEIAKLLAARFLGRPVSEEEDLVEIKKLEDEAEAVKIAISGLQHLQQKLDRDFEVDRILKEASPSLRTNLAYLDLKTQRASDEDLRNLIEFYLDNDRQLKVQSGDFPGGQTALIAETEVTDIYQRRLQILKDEVDLLLGKISEPVETDGPPKIDVLLLAGQSSQFPTVSQMFENLAHHIDFVKDPMGQLVLKECVSLGALYYSFILHGDLDVKITGLDRVWTRVGRPKFKLGVGAQFQELIPWGMRYPYESSPFHLTETDVDNSGKLVLRVFENLSMSDKPHLEPFKDFELPVNGVSQNRFVCRLRVSDEGVFSAQCQIKDEWLDMSESKK